MYMYIIILCEHAANEIWYPEELSVSLLLKLFGFSNGQIVSVFSTKMVDFIHAYMYSVIYPYIISSSCVDPLIHPAIHL